MLVAEDFEVLAQSIATGLRREGMAVDVALDGADALSRLAVTRYDVRRARPRPAGRAR